MIKIRDNSRIEIWSNEYINDVERRQEKDKKVEVIQIEIGASPKDYMVEVTPNK